MNIKRLLAIVLVCMLTLVLMAGCGDKPSESGDSSDTPGSSTTTTGAPDIGGDSTTGGDSSNATTGSGESSTSGTTASGTTGTKKPTTTGTKAEITLPGKVTTATKVETEKVDLSGRVTDLKGRVIKFQIMTQTSTNATDANGQKVQKGFEMVEQKYNCKIEVVKCDFESIGDSRVLNSMLAGNPIADILVQGADTFYSRYKAGLLENLSALKAIDFDSADSVHPPWGIAAKVNGDYYSYTNDDGGGEMAFTPVVVYNKKLLEEYTPQYANTPWNLYKSGEWTWEKFFEICDTFNRAVKNYGDMTAVYDGGGTVYKTMLVTAGTDWLTYNKAGDIIFNARDSKAQDIMNKYKSYVQKGTVKLVVAPRAGLNNDFDSLSGCSDGYGFKSGKAAFAIATFNNGYYWDGMMSAGTQQSVKDNMGVLPLPKWDKKDSYQTLYPLMVRGTSIPSGLDKPNEVATILSAIFTETGGHYLNGYVEGEKHYIDQWYAPTLTAKMGKQNREVMEKLYNDFHNHTITPYVGDLGSLTAPDVMCGVDDSGNTTGWYNKYVFEIANGNIAQSAALDAVEDKFNKILKSLTTVR